MPVPFLATLIQTPSRSRGWPPARPRTRPRSRTSGRAVVVHARADRTLDARCPCARSRPWWPRWRSWPHRRLAPRRPRRRTGPPDSAIATRSKRIYDDYRRDGKIDVCEHERVDLQEALDTIEPDFDTRLPGLPRGARGRHQAPRRRPLRRRRRTDGHGDRHRRPRPDADDRRRDDRHAAPPDDDRRHRRQRRDPARGRHAARPRTARCPPDAPTGPRRRPTAPAAVPPAAAATPAATPDAARSSPRSDTDRPADPGHPARHRPAGRGGAGRVRARLAPLAALQPRLARGRVPHPRNVGGFLRLAAPRPLSRGPSLRAILRLADFTPTDNSSANAGFSSPSSLPPRLARPPFRPSRGA